MNDDETASNAGAGHMHDSAICNLSPSIQVMQAKAFLLQSNISPSLLHAVLYDSQYLAEDSALPGFGTIQPSNPGMSCSVINLPQHSEI